MEKVCFWVFLKLVFQEPLERFFVQQAQSVYVQHYSHGLRPLGFEPKSSPWKGEILPLDDGRSSANSEGELVPYAHFVRYGTCSPFGLALEKLLSEYHLNNFVAKDFLNERQIDCN